MSQPVFIVATLSIQKKLPGIFQINPMSFSIQAANSATYHNKYGVANMKKYLHTVFVRARSILYILPRAVDRAELQIRDE